MAIPLKWRIPMAFAVTTAERSAQIEANRLCVASQKDGQAAIGKNVLYLGYASNLERNEEALHGAETTRPL